MILDGFHEPLLQDPTRSSGKGGGLVTWVNTRVCEEDEIEPVTTYSEPDNNSGEFQFFKIINCKKSKKSVIIGNVYRSPALNPNKFNDLFNKVLQKLHKSSGKHTCIVGDFNEDLIKHDDVVSYQNLVDNAASHGFLQIVSRPTRVTENSATLIDHVYTNNLNSTHSCNILTLDISDHLATCTKISLESSNLNIERHTINKEENVECRVFNDAGNEAFKTKIQEESWNDVFDESLDVNTLCNKFIGTYNEHYDTAYPLKTKKHVAGMKEKIASHGFYHGLKMHVLAKINFTIIL